jgi:hypothetical protein
VIATVAIAAAIAGSARHGAASGMPYTDAAPVPASQSGSVSVPADDLPKSISVPVFTEQWCHVTRPRDIKLGRMTAVDTYECISRFGSAFAYQSGDTVLLITAAHVAPPPGQVQSITTKDGAVLSSQEGYSLEQGDCKVRIGGLAVKPKRWFRDPDLDVALFEVSANDLEPLNMEVLSAGSVKRNDEVKLWGFPAIPQQGADGRPLPSVPSASQASQRSDVTDVRADEVVCAPLNGVETRGGFSGGPVLNSQGQVVGMIMRSTQETTRCRSMPAIDKMAKGFKGVDYTDPPRPKV